MAVERFSVVGPVDRREAARDGRSGRRPCRGRRRTGSPSVPGASSARSRSVGSVVGHHQERRGEPRVVHRREERPTGAGVDRGDLQDGPGSRVELVPEEPVMPLHLLERSRASARRGSGIPPGRSASVARRPGRSRGRRRCSSATSASMGCPSPSRHATDCRPAARSAGSAARTSARCRWRTAAAPPVPRHSAGSALAEESACARSAEPPIIPTNVRDRTANLREDSACHRSTSGFEGERGNPRRCPWKYLRSSHVGGTD